MASRTQETGGQVFLEVDICTLSTFFMAALTNALDIKYLVEILQYREIQDEFIFAEDLT